MATTELHTDLSDTVRTLMTRATGDQATTGAALATALDQHAPNISGKLRGRRAWSLDDLFALSEHYGVSLDTLAAMMAESRAHRSRVEHLTD